MTQKERVVGLFEFIMDLLDEKEPKQVEEVEGFDGEKQVEEPNVSKDTKQLEKPTSPHHPLLNPYISGVGKQEWVDNSLDLIARIASIDEERSKIKMVDNITRPLIKEIEDLKKQGQENARLEKIDEELESIVSEVGDKLGITLENGKAKLVNVPNELRDNIPFDESELVNGGNDLPKHVIDKLDSKISEPITVTVPTRPRKKVIKTAPTIKVNNRKKK